MMIQLEQFLAAFTAALTDTFGGRICFAGLQGSYARGEADEISDIDPVVILDALDAPDIRRYRAMLDTLPSRELICGFLAGKAEFRAWDRADLVNFYFTTDPLIGSLDALIEPPTRAEAMGARQLGACNLYHGCIHSMLHGRRIESMREMYKSAVFVVQAAHFVETGVFIRRHDALAQAVGCPDHAAIVRMAGELRRGEAVDYDKAADMLFRFAKSLLA